MQKKIFEKPYLALLPFLLLYISIVLLQNSETLFGDEGRYLQFAENLLNGFYSPQPPEINLWNGPGFPLYLLPFVAFNIPHIIIKLFNAGFYFASLLLFNKTLRKFIDPKKSFLISVLFGLYYMPFKSLPHIFSETFAIFLISVITFFATEYFAAEEKRKHTSRTIMLSFFLAMLALTKVMFGQVYLLAAILFFILFLVTKNAFYRKAMSLLLYALLFCSPYLFYTYSFTGKIFYWSNAGGMSLYWMSNPASGEWGEWYNDSLSSSAGGSEAVLKLKANHQEEYDEIHKYAGIERDEKYKEFARKNIKEHPEKFFINWIANGSRMFFNYPVSYAPIQLSTIGNMIANIPIILLIVYSAVLTWRNKKELPFALKFLLIISGIYLLGCSMLSAYDRMFYILTPIIGLWIAYSLSFFRNRETANQKSK